MPLLIILVLVGFLMLLQRKIYEKNWSKGLDAQVDLGKDRYIFQGDSIQVEETLSNDKLLPLPWVYVKYQLSVNGRPRIYCSEMFSITFRQRIRRKRSYVLEDRGVYTLGSVDLVSHDLFLTKTLSKVATDRPGRITVYPRLLEEQEWPVSCRQMMGEIITRRFTLEDPYLFKGIREYQDSDSLRSINFRASARAGQWMVNVHELTVSQKVTLLLGMDKGAQYYDAELYEHALRIAGTLAARCEGEGIPVGLISNGTDALLKTPITVSAGCGQEHIYEILEALARMDIEKEEGTITEVLAEVGRQADPDTLYILITPCYKEEIREAFEGLCSRQSDCRWILPVTSFQLQDEDFLPRDWEERVPGFYLWKL